MIALFYRPWRQKEIGLIALAWTLLLTLSHGLVPPESVWIVAGLFSASMNLIYTRQAFAKGQDLRLETGIAVTLILCATIGAFLSPPMVIFSVLAHAAWDLAKHAGVGVAFFRWYTLGCATIDLIWGGLLWAYWAGITI
ncbi:hypothetical protein TRP8649_04093 [Pelagimonas phthalicica]|uniref:Uncharacterized protein n=1 Tax=Pelagimonas phthalicica TaxID=1037362 RepID=A0A238JHT2_9RHOB|nr:hypothetical protein [Pelagimonas phthalicica]TDS89785.1 hypothetical protein CLV87_3837 [Pelagimonas phthalicica]SMX29953.1 hypothetical protein TRP8649_04093 [Pelagimonas phthalicica]